MKKVTKETLLKCAHNLMFDLTDDELNKLLIEFEIIKQQMSLIGEIEEVDKAEPMSFPFELQTEMMREDVPSVPVEKSELLKNTKEVENGQIKLPKVVKDE